MKPPVATVPVCVTTVGVPFALKQKAVKLKIPLRGALIRGLEEEIAEREAAAQG